jgi:hypothetical protein
MRIEGRMGVVGSGVWSKGPPSLAPPQHAVSRSANSASNRGSGQVSRNAGILDDMVIGYMVNGVLLSNE